MPSTKNDEKKFTPMFSEFLSTSNTSTLKNNENGYRPQDPMWVCGFFQFLNIYL